MGNADIIKAAVNRFLAWPLPRDFSPDCGLSFDGRKDDEWNKNKTWPIGTNLFTAEQATAMFKHCLAALPAQKWETDANQATRFKTFSDDARDAATFDLPGPQIVEPKHGREPSLREVLVYYYCQDAPIEKAEQLAQRYINAAMQEGR